MSKILFIGQERSKLAQERGVYWEDEAQCANQLFRAAYPAMVKTANSILINERAEEIEKELTSIKEMMDLIPGTK